MPKPPEIPIEHPCVWRGDELLRHPDWCHQLSPEQVDEIETGGEMPGCRALFDKIASVLEQGPGAALVRGVPVDGLSEEGAKGRFLMLSRLLGTAVSQSAEGELVFSVRDAGTPTTTRAPAARTRARNSPSTPTAVTSSASSA